MDLYFYPGPTQIKFITSDGIKRGIVYQTLVIDVDGVIYNLDNIYSEARKLGYCDDDTITEMEWKKLDI